MIKPKLKGVNPKRSRKDTTQLHNTHHSPAVVAWSRSGLCRSRISSCGLARPAACCRSQSPGDRNEVSYVVPMGVTGGSDYLELELSLRRMVIYGEEKEKKETNE